MRQGGGADVFDRREYKFEKASADKTEGGSRRVRAGEQRRDRAAEQRRSTGDSVSSRKRARTGRSGRADVFEQVNSDAAGQRSKGVQQGSE